MKRSAGSGKWGSVVQGDDKDNTLYVTVTQEENGGITFYNVLHGAGGNDLLDGRIVHLPSINVRVPARMFGDEGNDTIYGTVNDDEIFGGDGNDKIYFEAGGDVIDGGAGRDTVYMDGWLNILSRPRMTHVEEIVLSGPAEAGTFDFSTIEAVSYASELYGGDLNFSKKAHVKDLVLIGDNWEIYGSRFDDSIDLSPSRGDLTVNGGVGDDIVVAGSGRNVLDGASGDDKLVGNGGADDLYGADGNDHLLGGEGNDRFEGGEDDDLLVGGAGNDYLMGEDGNDTIQGGSGNDKIFVGYGDDKAYGGSGNDIITGRDPAGWTPETLAKERKLLSGGAGDDIFSDWKFEAPNESTFLGGAGTDQITLGWDIHKLVIKGIEILKIPDYVRYITADAKTFEGFDQIIGGDSEKFEFRLTGGGLFEWKAGWQDRQNGKVSGSDAADYIDMSASKGSWNIDGGGGEDVMVIGSGRAVLTGQAGSDTFVLGKQPGRAVISDFDAEGRDHDLIDVSAGGGSGRFEDIAIRRAAGDTDGVTIRIGSSEITLLHLDAADLDRSDFLF